MSNKILVLNGPNLNLLGVREPGIYGKSGLAEINAGLKKIAEENGIELETFQSNAEFEIINKIHRAVRTLRKMRPRRLPAPRLRRMRRL